MDRLEHNILMNNVGKYGPTKLMTRNGHAVLLTRIDEKLTLFNGMVMNTGAVSGVREGPTQIH